MTDYIIDTKDCCVGDEVKFKRAIFSGSYRKPKFEGLEDIEGKIVNESYGAEKQQHTFTIEKADGVKIRIKGRNLYREGVRRKLWADEAARKVVLEEKHARGEFARAERDGRWRESGQHQKIF